MRLRVHHTTRYTYPTAATDSHNEVRLMPLTDGDQTCLDFRLTTTPPAAIGAFDTPWGRVHFFNIRQPQNEMVITADMLVVTNRHDPFAELDLVGDNWEFYHREAIRQRYIEYTLPTSRVPLHEETDRIAQSARRQSNDNAASFLITLTRLLHRAYTYAPGATNVNTTLHQVLEEKRGVCQDFAHLMLSVCRRQGIPARYVSGYLYTGEDRVTEEHGGSRVVVEGDGRGTGMAETGEGRERPLVSGDASHAWVECLLPNETWCGFDPTNNLLSNDHYIKIHVGRDYGDVPPVRGVYHGPFAHSLDVSVAVRLDS